MTRKYKIKIDDNHHHAFSKNFKKTLVHANVAIALSLVNSMALADWASCSDDGTTNTCSGTYVVEDQSRFDFENVVISNTGNWNISGPQGAAVYINNRTLNANNVSINTKGLNGDGIKTINGGGMTINGKLYMKIDGMSADAINVQTQSNATITVGDNAEVYVNNTLIGGVGLRANLAQGSANSNNIIFGKNAIIETKGGGRNGTDGAGYAVYAGNRDTETVGMTNGKAKVVLGDGSRIKTEGANAHTVYANKTGEIFLGSTQIVTTKAGAHGLYAEDGSVTFNGNTQDFEGGKIYLLGDTIISVTDPSSSNKSYAIYSNGKDSIIESSTGTGAATSGKFAVSGDMRVNDLGKIDLRMTDGSVFEGNTSITGTGGTLNLDIAGANSRWQMTESSQLTDLKLASGAHVILGNQADPLTAANQVMLSTENLSGNGHFYLRTDIISSDTGPSINISDKIKVTGSSSGLHKIFVKDNNTGGATGEEIVRIAEIADGKAKFILSNPDGYVDMGAFKYNLAEMDPFTPAGNEKHWYLTTKATGNGGGEKTNTADHAANILNINYLLNYVETQTLLQRMGELRKSGNTEGDAWVRAYTGKLDSFSDGILEGFDMDYTGVQIGADKQFIRTNGDFYLGGMAGTAKAEANYQEGDGKTTSYHAGIYATYKANNGFYIDGIAKYVWMENTLNTTTGGKLPVKGDGDTKGYSIGIETGKRFYLTEANAGWYAEPQAQLTFAHQDGATIQASNGLRTDLDSFDSTLGRISAIIGYSIVDGKNPVDVYFKTGYVKEFDGDTGYTYNNTIHESYKLNGNWWDNGIGITAQINKKHNLYLDATYSSGNKFDQMQLNAGYRYSF